MSISILYDLKYSSDVYINYFSLPKNFYCKFFSIGFYLWEMHVIWIEDLSLLSSFAFFSGRNPNDFMTKDHFSAYGSFNQISNMNLNYKSMCSLTNSQENYFSHLVSTKKWPALLLSFCYQWADIFFSLSYNIGDSLSRTNINCKHEHRMSCSFPFLYLKKSNCSSLVSP